MNRFRLSLLISAMVFNHFFFAAAFQLYELGAPVIGTAGVGQAVVDDASIAYYNPAGMGFLQSSQFMLGSQMLVSYINFSQNSSNTIRGDNGGNAGMLIPGMGLYYVHCYSPKIKWGVNITSPYGGSLTYNDGWTGRYNVQSAAFFTVDLNPSISYRFNDWLALGAGVTLEYFNLQQTVALPILPLVDGQVKVSVANYAPGFNAGVMVTPFSSTKIGLAFRSQIVHDLHGNATFLRINSTPNTSTRMVTPANVILSAAQDISNRFSLLGELGWANWSTMHNNILTVDGFSVVTPEDWRNTYRFGLGGKFKVNPCFLLQLGASYDTSPTTSSKRLPELPMDRQLRLGAGLLYKIIKPVTLGASYEYINFGNANINNVSTNGVLSGSYSRNYANTFQVSLNVEA